MRFRGGSRESAKSGAPEDRAVAGVSGSAQGETDRLDPDAQQDVDFAGKSRQVWAVAPPAGQTPRLR